MRAGMARILLRRRVLEFQSPNNELKNAYVAVATKIFFKRLESDARDENSKMTRHRTNRLFTISNQEPEKVFVLFLKICFREYVMTDPQFFSAN